MIKSIQITNFESHENTFLEFGSGVNALIGDSDNGKSAVLRALLWVIANRPVGTSFCSHWGGTTSVVLVTDKAKISRIRSSKENKYVLELPNEKPMVFEAMKQLVPQEIIKYLDVKPINIQTQFDGHFLLPPISSGEVARQINQFVDLEIIDTTLYNINSIVRSYKKTKNEYAASLSLKEKEIKEYDYLKEADELLNKIENDKKKEQSLSDKYSELVGIQLKFNNILSFEKKYKNTEKKGQDLAKIEKSLKEKRDKEDEYYILITALKKLNVIKEAMKNLHEKHNEQKLNVISKKIERIKILSENLIVVEEQKNKYFLLEKKIRTASISIDTIETELEKLISVGSLCPLCGQTIK